MKRFRFACLFLVLVSAMMLAQSNPVPLIVQPLVPASVAPGSNEFTLTVHGTGFGRNAAVYWNGSIRQTTVVSRRTVRAKITAADVASAGTASITVANPGMTFSNVVYFPIRDSVAGLGFLEKDQTGAATGPLVVGDFNNDGNLDIAVSDGKKIKVFLGKGKGQFDPPIVVSTTLTVTYAIVAGDFNGDGKPDLAIRGSAPFKDNHIQVFLGKGDGTFNKQKSFRTAGKGTVLAVAGDFNGDGNLDLYVDGSSKYDGPYFELLPGNGDGTFNGNLFLGGFSCGAADPAIADFDGDGLLDVAAVDRCDGVTVTLHSGTRFTYPIDTYGGKFIAAADVNGDGKIDLVTDGVSVLLGNGDGTFTDGGGVASQGAGVSINLGDFNGDGKLDIAAGISTLLGNGDGTFQDPLTFAGLFPGGPLSVGDFTGEGKLDLAGFSLGSGDPLTVYWQVRVYLTPVKIDFGDQNIGSTSPPQTATLTNFDPNTLIIQRIKITGKNSADFAQTNNCAPACPRTPAARSRSPLRRVSKAERVRNWM